MASRVALAPGGGSRRLDPPTCSEIIGPDHLAAGPSSQPGEDADVHGGVQEMHGAVCIHGVGPAGVEAIDLPVVRAIDGAGAVKSGPVRRGTLDEQQVSGSPGAA